MDFLTTKADAELQQCPLTYSPEGRELLAALFGDGPTLDEQAAKLDSMTLGDRWE